MTNSAEGPVFALHLDTTGRGKSVDGSDGEFAPPPTGLLWVHLDYQDPWASDWVRNRSGIDPVICEALLTDETRPRCVAHHDGLLVILRGVNLNPRSEPEDMVSVRLWITERRVVTLRHRRLMAVQELRQASEGGDGPREAGEFLVRLCDGMLDKMAPVMSDLDDEVDELEDQVLDAQGYELRSKIGGLRRQTIRMRRYLAPQRDVINRLQAERVGWLNDLHRVHLRELADRTTRYVEDLDSAKDRAAVAQDELNNRLAEQMNKTMYVLSIVAAIFLPLGLLTGLLGINVGGIPGTESPVAFAIVCGMLLVIAVVQTWLFRRMHWI